MIPALTALGTDSCHRCRGMSALVLAWLWAGASGALPWCIPGTRQAPAGVCVAEPKPSSSPALTSILKLLLVLVVVGRRGCEVSKGRYTARQVRTNHHRALAFVGGGMARGDLSSSSVLKCTAQSRSWQAVHGGRAAAQRHQEATFQPALWA